MDIETTRTKMVAQVSRAQSSAMAKVINWTFKVDGLVVYVELRPRHCPENVYLLRVSFDDFPRRAPSYVFVDQGKKEMTEQAWPPDVKHGAEPPGICTPGTREFHEHWHKNDMQHTWDPEKYSFHDTLLRIHQLMERGVAR